MAITYTWTVNDMSTLPTPQPDFVVQVAWTCTGTDGTYTSDIGSITTLPDVEGESFTPYADLTEATVVQWVKDELGEQGVNSIQGSVEGSINAQANPPVSPTPEPLPW
tara:strand:+ start:1934 stop:2257 length:324 start_codon:yes stop_codon:yes gene_type:complete